MKTSLLILSVSISMTYFLQAQNIEYKVIYDSPVKPKTSVNIDLLQLDAGFSNTDGTSFNLGSYGHYMPDESIGIDYNLKFSWLAFGKSVYSDYPGNFELNLGAFYRLRSENTVKNTKVVVKAKDIIHTTANNESNVSRQYTYITVPANRYKESGVRGGIYRKSGAFNYSEYKRDRDYLGDTAEMKLSSTGIYAGLYMSSIKNVFVETNEYGIQYTSIGDDFYADILLVPFNRFSDLQRAGENVTSYVKENKGAVPLGFRFGWKRYQVEKKERTNKRFGLSYMGETGYKPYQGWFVNGGIGISIIK